MATIGALTADLSVNSAAFVADVGKARRALSSGSAKMNRSLATMDRGFARVRRSVARNVRGLVSFRSALATVAGSAGLGLLVKKSLDVADAIGKTADKIGISTDALQEYRFAADLAGVAQETLEKSFTFFTKTVGEAGLETGELVTILAKYDQTLLDTITSSGSVEEKLQAIFRVLAKVEDAFIRNALAAKFFGRGGVEMINMVRDGAAALEAMRKQARDMGLVIEESLIRDAEEAKDKLSILATVTKTRVTTAIIQLAPEINQLATAFADAIPKIVAVTKGVAAFFGLIEKDPLPVFEERLSKVNREIAFLRDAPLEDIAAKFEKIFSKDPTLALNSGQIMEDLQTERTRLIEEIDRLRKERSQAAAPENQGRVTTTGPTPFSTSQMDSFKKALEDVRKKRLEHNEVVRNSTAALSLEVVQQAQLTAALGRSAEEYRALKAEIELENAATRLNIDLASQQGQAWAAAFRQAQEAAAGLAKASEERDKAIATIRAGVETVGDTLSSAVSDVLFYGKTWADVARGIGQSIIQSLVESLIKAGTQMAANFAISQTFGAAAAAAAVGEGAAVAAAWAPAAALASLATLGGNAVPAAAALTSTAALSQGLALIPREQGGPVTAGRGYLVGEAGPEAFFPKTGGTVVPNDAGGGGRGGAVNVNFTIIANDTRGFDDLLRARRGMIVNMVNRAVNEQGRPAIA